MISFVFSPQWFYGIDSFFEFLALGIMALISLYCYISYYKLCGEKSYRYFSYAFFSIVASFAFKILANITIFYDHITEKMIGPYTFTITSIQQSDLFLLVGTTFHYFFFLLGLLMLFLIIYKQTNKQTIGLLVLLILISTIFSHASYILFYITSCALLLLIFLRYWSNFVEKRTRNSLSLALSFLFILISHVIFIFVFLNLQLYVVAEVTQLFGFILLLMTFMSVLVKARALQKRSPPEE